MGWALCRVLRDKVRAPKTPPPLVLTVGMGAERMRQSGHSTPVPLASCLLILGN